MARPGQPRVTPEVSLSPTTAPDPTPRDRPVLPRALGGGRRRGADGSAVAAPVARELWLAVHLPHYVLESLDLRAATTDGAAPARGAAPVVVVDVERGGKVVCDRDARAAAAGVVPGMALNSALSLEPDLRVASREPRRERALLDALAMLAREFTPRVSLEPPDGVLLEVRGSLRLFGGARALCAQLRERLQARGLEARLALTPAPLASLWFARAGEEVALRRPDTLPSRLASLPLGVTRWPARTLQTLATLGVRVVGDCLRLPRDGFARRFEPRLRLDLDRALGQAPDPRASFVAAERCTLRRDLEPEITDTGRLQRVVEPLLEELCAHLRGRGAAIGSLELRLLHREAPPTRLRLRFAEPVAVAGRIAALLQERFARTELPAAVRSLRLRSGAPVEARAEVADLFARDRRRSAAVPQLVERLRARLGGEAVHGLCLVAEHRPEAAQKSGDILVPGSPAHAPAGKRREEAGGSAAPRPVWLLAVPQPLEGGDLPRYEGALEIEEGPERIESGWWDGGDVRRDYYVARNPAGVRLWIFRERRAAGGWFLHGVFG
jgi:protein ImuB